MTQSLETLIALNDEILALTRAGIPLGRGLLAARRNLGGKLHRIAGEIGTRLERGESFVQILDDSSFPLAYTAVVKAGVASGELTRALEAVALILRRKVDTRRHMLTALTYPSIVVLVAAVLFSVLFHPLYTRVREFLAQQSVAATIPFSRVLSMVDAYSGIAVWVAVALVGLACLVWWRSGRIAFDPAGQRWSFPGLDRHLRVTHAAEFLSILDVLLARDVTLPMALRLAADCSASSVLRRDARRLADCAEQGMTFNSVNRRSGIPALALWTLLNDRTAESKRDAIRALAETYHHRARWNERWTRDVLPILATLMIGGVTVAVYAVVMLGPWFSVLQRVDSVAGR